MSGVPTRLKIERTGEIPPDARVCHYDELDERVKERLAEAVGPAAESGRESPSITGVGSVDCDVVKFTDYYTLRDV